jgi:hypothetical protein
LIWIKAETMKLLLNVLLREKMEDLIMPQCAGPNSLAAFLREHSLEELAKWLGQNDRSAKIIESAANDNRSRKRLGLWRQLWARLRRHGSEEAAR